MKTVKYPFLSKLNIPHDEGCVKWADLDKVLREYKIEGKFNEYFGVQTCPENGCFPWDCEVVLHRIFKNELIGSQFLWD